MSRVWVLLALGLGSSFLTGCPSAPKETDPAAPLLDCREVLARHNGRSARITQVWARAVVEIEWEDEKGKNHFEQGDGPLIVRKPSEMALAIGKLGNTMYWLGCDEKRAWFFDLNPPQGQKSVAHLATHEELASGRSSFPLPVQPEDLLALLAIGVVEEHSDFPLRSEGKYCLLELPVLQDGVVRAIRRIRFDGRTGHPVAMVILGPAPESAPGKGPFTQLLAQANLERYEPLRLEGEPPGDRPEIPTRIEISIPESKARLVLFLSDATNGKSSGKIKDVQFDFEKLLELLKPEGVEGEGKK